MKLSHNNPKLNIFVFFHTVTVLLPSLATCFCSVNNSKANFISHSRQFANSGTVITTDLLSSIGFDKKSVKVSYRCFNPKSPINHPWHNKWNRVTTSHSMAIFPTHSSGTNNMPRNTKDAGCKDVLYFNSPFLPLPEQKSNVNSSNYTSDRDAMVILNSPIQNPPSFIFNTLWNKSSFRICADGGANRLFDATTTFCKNESDEKSGYDNNIRKYIPDLIKGDLDSLRKDVKAHYQRLGTIVEQDNDQNSNDLDKALQAVRGWTVSLAEKSLELDYQKRVFTKKTNEIGNTKSAAKHTNERKDKYNHLTDVTHPKVARLPCDDDEKDSSCIGQSISPSYPKEKKTRVYVYGAFGGRFDQEMANIQALYKWGEIFGSRIVLYNDETCAFLLPAGITNEIRLPFTEDYGEGPTCGLVPLGCRCEFVITTGLKWNLDGSTALEFGGLVSTSNHIVDQVVTVQSSHPLIFTAEIK